MKDAIIFFIILIIFTIIGAKIESLPDDEFDDFLDSSDVDRRRSEIFSIDKLDHLELVIQWVPGLCYTNLAECDITRLSNRFTIRGLWPIHKNPSIQATNCDNKEWDKQKVETLLDRMEVS